jgi:hypothetical protein
VRGGQVPARRLHRPAGRGAYAIHACLICALGYFQLGHSRLPTNLMQMASPGPSRVRGGSGRLGNAACLGFASMVRAANSAALSAPHAVINDVRRDGRRKRNDLISRRKRPQCDDVGYIKIGVEFITALARQWKGSSHPNPAGETMDSMAAEELVPGVDSVAVRPESQINIKPEASLNKQEIERRREIVRHFFNDFWTSTDDKPRTFAERLNRAEDHINERLAARGERWQLENDAPIITVDAQYLFDLADDAPLRSCE